MKTYNIDRLLQLLGCRNIRVSGNKVMATCPFEHDHSGGRDNSPSFVVFAKEGKESQWHCSYPHSDWKYINGNMDHMVRLYAEATGLPYSTVPWGKWVDRGLGLHGLYRYIWQRDSCYDPEAKELSKYRDLTWDPRRKFQKKFYKKSIDIPEKDPLPSIPENFLNSFNDPTGDVLDYLMIDRGLTRETIDHWELKYDSPRNRLVIPIRNIKGGLVAISRRALLDYQTPKYLHMKGFQRKYYLFGENPKALAPVLPKDRRGIIVEGQFDVIRLWQLGYRGAVAIYGANMTKEQLYKFKRIFSRGIVLMDGDEAGKKAADKIRKQLQAFSIPLEIKTIPEKEKEKEKGIDPGSISFTPELAESILGVPDIDNVFTL